MTPEIQTDDVVLDLVQGRSMHVIEVHDGDTAEWSEANGYELTENYGNSRLGASDDAVVECVYCSSIKSEPSKSYASPESCVARIETEAADDGWPVADRVRVQLLAALRAEMVWRTDEHSDERKVFSAAAVSAARNVDTSEDAIDEACGLAEVERTIGGGE